MANKDDHLTYYREFFENFAQTVNPNDQLPVKLASYKLVNVEVVGGIIDWTTQYLSQKKCPPNLLAPLIRIVIDEIRKVCKKQPTNCGFVPSDNAYEPLKLMQTVMAKTNEVCLRYLDNSMLCSLPSPDVGIPYCITSVYAVKNTRRRMEDRHVVIHDLNTMLNIQDASPSSYYAVFDGHAGHDAAAYSSAHLHQFLTENKNFATNPKHALQDAFCKTDALFMDKCKVESLNSGTTAVVALLRPKEKKLYVAWAGDSQALLVSKRRIFQIVNPHKPCRKDERERIENVGGCVILWGTWRVNGQLAVSRAIGDPEYKPFVIAVPDIQEILLDNDDFLVLACDGLWDSLSEESVARAVYALVTENPEDTDRISQRLVQIAKEQGSTDNISVIVVFLREPSKIAAEANWANRNLNPATMEAGLDNSNNPFSMPNGTNTDNIITQKTDGLLLNLTDNFKQNGTDSQPTDYFSIEKSNGKRLASEFDDDDDFGPETDIDALDDVLSPDPIDTITKTFAGAFPPSPNNNLFVDEGVFNPFMEHQEKAALEMEKNMRIRDSGEGFEDEKRAAREETPTPPADAVHDVGGLVENPADSESEDEWNYYKGDTANKENTSPQPEKEVADIPEEDDTMSQLNPNAAEFVPVSPTRSVASPTCRMLISNDQIVSQSPKKANDVDLNVPLPRDFEKEVKSRPSEIDANSQDSDDEHGTSNELMENVLNGKNIDEIPEFHPGSTPKKIFPSDEFHFGPNAAPFTPKLLDQSEALSTKAVYGDDTVATLETSFDEDSNVVKKESDPMSMSFYADKGEENPFDLNKVQVLPDNLEEFLNKNDTTESFNETISDLPEHEPLGEQSKRKILNNDDAIQITDLDKQSYDDEKELASPLEPEKELMINEETDFSKTPEPTRENLLPHYFCHIIPKKPCDPEETVESIPADVELIPSSLLHPSEAIEDQQESPMSPEELIISPSPTRDETSDESNPLEKEESSTHVVVENVSFSPTNIDHSLVEEVKEVHLLNTSDLGEIPAAIIDPITIEPTEVIGKETTDIGDVNKEATEVEDLLGKGWAEIGDVNKEATKVDDPFRKESTEIGDLIKEATEVEDLLGKAATKVDDLLAKGSTEIDDLLGKEWKEIGDVNKEAAETSDVDKEAAVIEDILTEISDHLNKEATEVEDLLKAEKDVKITHDDVLIEESKQVELLEENPLSEPIGFTIQPKLDEFARLESDQTENIIDLPKEDYIPVVDRVKPACKLPKEFENLSDIGHSEKVDIALTPEPIPQHFKLEYPESESKSSVGDLSESKSPIPEEPLSPDYTGSELLNKAEERFEELCKPLESPQEDVTSSVKDDLPSPVEDVSSKSPLGDEVAEIFTKEEVVEVHATKDAKDEPVSFTDVKVVEQELPVEDLHKSQVILENILQGKDVEEISEIEPSDKPQEILAPVVSSEDPPKIPTEPERDMIIEPTEQLKEIPLDLKTEIISPEFAESTIVTPSEESKAECLAAAATPEEAAEELPTEEQKLADQLQNEMTALGVASAVATGAAITAVVSTTKTEEKKKTPSAPPKKPITKTPTPSKSAASTAKTTPRLSSSATKQAANKSLNTSSSKAQAPSPKTTGISKPTASPTPKPSPKPSLTKTRLTPLLGTKTTQPARTEKIPLANGDIKTSARSISAKKSVTETNVKSTTTKPSTTTRVSSTQSRLGVRPATATTTTAPRTTVPPRSAPLASRAVPNPKRPTSLTHKSASGRTSPDKISSTVKANLPKISPKSTTNVPPKPKLPTTNLQSKSRVPPTKTVAKAADTEKQIKDSANKITASRSASSAKALGSTTSTTTKTGVSSIRRVESKVSSTRTTVSKTSTTTMKSTTAKKPVELVKGGTVTNTKTKTTKIEKPKENGISTIVTEEITVVNNTNAVIDDSHPELLIKDNSPVDNKLLIETTTQFVETNVD